MQARTERNLGFVAALLLTAAAFAAPGLSTQIAHNDMAYEEQIQLALTGDMPIELRHFVDLNETMPEQPYCD
ncbi:hypothetical protein H721_00047 [Brucella ovis IntaBari-2006-46-332]|uniref:Uncharacterized protein n=1 Tax=Brucella ovis (strain ATCC 25840 / 63/290 / NCTC 10512) TaxID=444178 RepID=A0A0H3AQ80_BRUO2|nr:hypothetical protein [Brucella ovis]ABQ61108.1 hypothetical protein BOV_0050 [Brucella ovis ATCC 25840]ENR06022.1 hypothetical protein C010_00024 [Brucella ovis 80/125]ENR10971.1 hypothetical protein C961_00024 [Brucella ovis F8/05B]ENS96217.1 hypothetical protein B999_00363 [Brucella ovis 63/96]ENT01800.1 hypothetical protein C009_00038 [Brucella ovis 81/8]